ncbi:MAG: tetratricopeptide repeat protein, partial [Candidatus Odinarchaeota archaeon]
MTPKNNNGLLVAKGWIVEGKLEKALKLVENVEKSADITFEDRINSQIIKGDLMNRLGEFEEALNIATRSFEESKKHNMCLKCIDILLIKTEALWRLGRHDKSLETVLQAEKLLEYLDREKPTEIDLRRAMIASQIGKVYWAKSDNDQALQYFRQSLSLAEKINDKKFIAEPLGNIGAAYWYKGDNDRALKYCTRSLEILEETNDKQGIADILINIAGVFGTKGELDAGLEHLNKSLAVQEEIGNKHHIAATYTNIGEFYRQKGDLDRALESLETSVSIFEELGNHLYLSKALFRLVSVAIDMENVNKARLYLERLGDINSLIKNKLINQRYRVAEALVLRTNPRSRYRVKAEEILEQVVAEEIADHELTVFALLNLCDLLLIELEISNDPDVLTEIQLLV